MATDKEDPYEKFIHDNMTRGEISALGTIILKDKIERLKNKLFGWYYKRKNARKNKK